MYRIPTILFLFTSFVFSIPCFAGITDTIPGKDTSGNMFVAVEIDASYPAGDQAWNRFVASNINPEVPVKKKAPAGTYTVVIQFIVDKDGQLIDFEPLTNHGYGMEDEVIRMLKTSPRWKPAIQDGRKVKAFRRQPVVFQIDEEKRKRRKD